MKDDHAMEYPALPEFPESVKLSPDQRHVIESYTRRFPLYSDYTFASLWCWDVNEKVEISQLNGNLVIKFPDYFSDHMFYSFMGDQNVNETLDIIFSLIRDNPGYLPYLKLIPRHNLENISLNEKYKVTEDIDNYDYIYSLEKLALMQGGKYETARRFANKFQRLYSWEIKPFDLNDENTWEAIETLNQTWVSGKQQEDPEIKELATVRRFRTIHEKLEHFTLGLFAEGVLCGYSINELNHQGFTNCLFIYADADYHGVYPFMKKQIAARLSDMGYEHFNFQQDSGFKGLRRYKKSLRPAFYLKKLIISRSDDQRVKG